MGEFIEAEHVLYEDTVLKASTVKCQILIAKGIAKLATWPLLHRCLQEKGYAFCFCLTFYGPFKEKG